MAEAMSLSMSTKNDRVQFCRFHDQEQYQLFCKDCSDLVCLECLQIKHQKHTVCRIRDSENDVRMCLKRELLEKEGMVKLNEQIDVALNGLSDRKTDMIDEIEKEADWMKTQINLSKEHLLGKIASTFDEYVLGVQVNERLKSLKKQITEENIREYDFGDLVELLIKWRELLETETAISRFAESVKFEKTACEFSIGKIVSMKNSDEKREHSAQAKRFTSTFTQTERVEETEDEEDEWYEAEEKVDGEDSIECSSDVETQEKYPMLIKINKDVKHILKIIPVSERDAWILADRNLRFIKEHILEEKNYATDIDDIAVLPNGNVLLLCHTESYIMQLLPNTSIVRFANAKFDSATPRCLCLSQKENCVFICSSNTIRRWNKGAYTIYGYHIYIITMSVDGVMINWNQFDRENIGPPCNMVEFGSHVCIICQNLIKTNLHTIELLGDSTKNNCLTHDGAIGCSPSVNFECYGICSDHNSHLLVSDFRHHCVYALDEKLKYNKCVVSSTNWLHDPTSVVLWKSYLWIADKEQIFKFNYDSADSSLHA